MTETFELYVKETSNCPELPRLTLERLGPEWTGDSVLLPFDDIDETNVYRVVGWTDRFGGSPCKVRVAKVRHRDDVGFLVWGGNSGVKLLDPDAIPGVDEHSARGHGMTVVWVEDAGDLPDDVRAVVVIPRGSNEHAKSDR